jgi:hypothetical protein
MLIPKWSAALLRLGSYLDFVSAKHRQATQEIQQKQR